MASRIQFRRDTKARWAEVNPVLMSGEMGLETDTRRLKIGNGADAWNDLDYTTEFTPEDRETLTELKEKKITGIVPVKERAKLLLKLTDKDGNVISQAELPYPDKKVNSPGVMSATDKDFLNTLSDSIVPDFNNRLLEIETLIDSNPNEVIDKFNEIVAFLAGITDTSTLEGILAGISRELNGKMQNGATLESRKLKDGVFHITRKDDSQGVTDLDVVCNDILINARAADINAGSDSDGSIRIYAGKLENMPTENPEVSSYLADPIKIASTTTMSLATVDTIGRRSSVRLTEDEIQINSPENIQIGSRHAVNIGASNLFRLSVNGYDAITYDKQTDNKKYPVCYINATEFNVRKAQNSSISALSIKNGNNDDATIKLRASAQNSIQLTDGNNKVVGDTTFKDGNIYHEKSITGIVDFEGGFILDPGEYVLNDELLNTYSGGLIGIKLMMLFLEIRNVIPNGIPMPSGAFKLHILGIADSQLCLEVLCPEVYANYKDTYMYLKYQDVITQIATVSRVTQPNGEVVNRYGGLVIRIPIEYEPIEKIIKISSQNIKYELIIANSVPDSSKALFIDLWNEACGDYGQYNAQTGYFELNGLTDITYKQAIQIYNSPLEFPYAACVERNIRTNLCKYNSTLNLYDKRPNISYLVRDNKLEVLNIAHYSKNSTVYTLRPSNASYFIKEANKLRKVIGVIDAADLTVSNSHAFAAESAPLLTELFIKNLKCDLNLSGLSHLNTESISFIIANRLDTNIITLTVHPIVYGMLTDESNGGYHQLLLNATANNIQFATIE